MLRPLGYTNEVIDEDINVHNQPWVLQEGGMVFWLWQQLWLD